MGAEEDVGAVPRVVMALLVAVRATMPISKTRTRMRPFRG